MLRLYIVSLNEKQDKSGKTEAETDMNFFCTVRPRDTRPQAARTLQVHVFELVPKIFELNVFM